MVEVSFVSGQEDQMPPAVRLNSTGTREQGSGPSIGMDQESNPSREVISIKRKVLRRVKRPKQRSMSCVSMSQFEEDSSEISKTRPISLCRSSNSNESKEKSYRAVDRDNSLLSKGARTIKDGILTKKIDRMLSTASASTPSHIERHQELEGKLAITNRQNSIISQDGGPPSILPRMNTTVPELGTYSRLNTNANTQKGRSYMLRQRNSTGLSDFSQDSMLHHEINFNYKHKLAKNNSFGGIDKYKLSHNPVNSITRGSRDQIDDFSSLEGSHRFYPYGINSKEIYQPTSVDNIIPHVTQDMYNNNSNNNQLNSANIDRNLPDISKTESFPHFGQRFPTSGFTNCRDPIVRRFKKSLQSKENVFGQVGLHYRQSYHFKPPLPPKNNSFREVNVTDYSIVAHNNRSSVTSSCSGATGLISILKKGQSYSHVNSNLIEYSKDSTNANANTNTHTKDATANNENSTKNSVLESENLKSDLQKTKCLSKDDNSSLFSLSNFELNQGNSLTSELKKEFINTFKSMTDDKKLTKTVEQIYDQPLNVIPESSADSGFSTLPGMKNNASKNKQKSSSKNFLEQDQYKALLTHSSSLNNSSGLPPPKFDTFDPPINFSKTQKDKKPKLPPKRVSSKKKSKKQKTLIVSRSLNFSNPVSPSSKGLEDIIDKKESSATSKFVSQNLVKPSQVRNLKPRENNFIGFGWFGIKICIEFLVHRHTDPQRLDKNCTSLLSNSTKRKTTFFRLIMSQCSNFA